MDLLLDTHTLIWMAAGPGHLPVSVRAMLDDPANTVIISAAVAWEISIKVRIGKLPGAEGLERSLADDIVTYGFRDLPVTLSHAQFGGRLPLHHGDPFDRVLAAQSLLEGATLVSKDKIFDDYGVDRIWTDTVSEGSPHGFHEP